MSQFLRWFPRLTARIGALLVIVILAAGCGSSDEETSAAEGTAASTVADNGEGSGEVDGRHHARRQDRDAEPAERRAGRADDGGRPVGKPERSHPQRTVRGELGTAEGAAVRKAADSCLEHFSRETCAEMATPAQTPSARIDEPEDCLKAMSREECEALFAAQQAAREDGESVNVEQCIANPTPRCEEVLRPLLEAQRAASSDASK